MEFRSEEVKDILSHIPHLYVLTAILDKIIYRYQHRVKIAPKMAKYSLINRQKTDKKILYTMGI